MGVTGRRGRFGTRHRRIRVAWRFRDGANAVCILRTQRHASDAEHDQDKHGRRESDDAGEKREAAIVVFACARGARGRRGARCGHFRIVDQWIAPSCDECAV